MDTSFLKTGVLFALDKTGVNHLYRAKLHNQTIVLMYHGVSKDNWKVSSGNWLQVKESQFRKQMEHLKKHFNVVSIEEALHSNETLSKKPRVVLTFDDGYANNYTVAYPILKEFGIPATVFLVSEMINTNNLFWYDRLRTSLTGNLEKGQIEEIVQSYKENHPHTIDNLVDEFIKGFKTGYKQSVHEAYGILTSGQICEMQSSGLVSFDSHTHRHEIITQLNPGEDFDSISKSLEVLKGLGIDCGKVFCYPNGCYDKKHFEVLDRLGFKAAASTIKKSWDTSDHRFEIPRFGIGRNMEQPHFRGIASGMWKSIAMIIKDVKTKVRRAEAC